MAGRGPVPLVIFLGEVKEGVGDSGVVGDELMVEVGKAKERSYVFDFSEGWPSGNTVKLDRVHGKLSGLQNHYKVFDFGDVELAFLKLQVKVQFSHALEDMMGSFFMGRRVRGGDEEVVHIDDELSFGDHVLE